MRQIELSEICNALEKRMHYGEAGIDPADALEALFYGWRKHIARTHGRSMQSTCKLWDRGWLSTTDAADFCNYCIRGWKPPFLSK